jgi:hypothetical protein
LSGAGESGIILSATPAVLKAGQLELALLGPLKQFAQSLFGAAEGELHDARNLVCGREICRGLLQPAGDYQHPPLGTKQGLSVQHLGTNSQRCAMKPLTVCEMEAIEGGLDKCEKAALNAGLAIAIGTAGLNPTAFLSGGAAVPLLAITGFKFFSTATILTGVINACSS